jgi:hypothetical protein
MLLAAEEIELYQFPDIDSDEEEDFKVCIVIHIIQYSTKFSINVFSPKIIYLKALVQLHESYLYILWFFFYTMFRVAVK